jgi:hypothetical protein
MVSHNSNKFQGHQASKNMAVQRARMKRFFAAIAILLATLIPAHAQSRFVLPYQTVVDANGVPIPGALLNFYASGTSIRQNTYANEALSTPNSNPVPANSAGMFPNIFLSGSPYKVVLTDSLGNQIWTADPVFELPSIIGPTTSTVGDVACWNNTIGTSLADCGVININGTAATATVTGSLLINPLATASTFDPGFDVTQTISGTGLSGTTINLNSINVTDSAAATNNPNNNLIALGIYDNVGGSTVTGARVGLLSSFTLTAPTSASNAIRTYTAITGQAQSSVNDNGTSLSPAGSLFSFASGTYLHSGATFYNNLQGIELGLAAETGSSVAYKWGINVVPFPTDKVHASSLEAGYGLSANTGAVGLNWGILLHDGNGQTPLAAAGTILGTEGTDAVTNGIDLTANGANTWSFSGYAFRSPGYSVDGLGNEIVASLTGTNLAGSGTKCLQASNTGAVTIFGSGCGGSGSLVLINTINTPTGVTATFTNSSAVIGATNSFVVGQAVVFTNSGGALPTNFTAGTVYYVITTGLSSTQFEVASSIGGSAITAGSAGTGTQTVTTYYVDTTSITNAYTSYLIVFENLIPATTSNTLCMNLGTTAAGFIGGTSNEWVTTVADAGGSVGTHNSTGTTCLQLSGNSQIVANSDPGISGQAWLYNPAGSTAYKNFNSQAIYSATTNSLAASTAGGWLASTGIMSEIQLYYTGNSGAGAGLPTSGVVKIYGVL